jgi:hypothetical protein
MVNNIDSRVMGYFNMVILTSFSIHERYVPLSSYHSIFLYSESGFFLAATLESIVSNFVVKIMEVLVSFYQTLLVELSHPPDHLVPVLSCCDCYKLKLGFCIGYLLTR